MSGNAQFLLNTWYFSAWQSELASGHLARTISDVPLLFIPDGDGFSAMLDRCPHRFAPLSRGKIENGSVECGYHGLAFGGDGQCIRNPHGPIVSSLSVPTFPVVGRHDAIWVWLGDRESADPALIPDMSFIDRVPAVSRVSGHLENEANYMLMVENIMDLSHADYLHPTTLGNGINTRTKGKVFAQDGTIEIKWHADNELLPPAQDAFLPTPGERSDFRNEVVWHPPGIMVQRMAFGPTGKLETEGADSRTCHVMTPLSATRTHYFFCHTSDMVTADPSLAPHILEVLLAAFAGEDSPMLAAQQDRIGNSNFWDLQPALLPIDAGAVRVRRRMDELIAAEQAR